jgi:tetratricopeptide (TPR) repeat protein
LTRITNPNSKSYLTSKNKNIYNSKIAKLQGNFDKEISALNLTTNDFWSIYSLGEIYLNNNDYKNAIYNYQKAISLNPDYTQSYLSLAQAYIANKDFSNAIDVLNKYLTYNKNSDIAYAMRAKAYLNTNNIDKAENDIEKAINIEEDISYLLIEAKILYYKGDYSQAREKLNILSQNIQTSEVYKYIGLCDYAMGNYPSALLNTDKAIILSDDDKELNSKYNEIKSKLDKK